MSSEPEPVNEGMNICPYTEEQINKILNLKGNNGEAIDIFNLYGVLYIGNCKGGEWNLTENFTRHSTGGIAFTIDDFWDCTTEDQVHDTYSEKLQELIKKELT